MTTFQQLIDKVEADLADSGNTTWSAADVTRWVRDAIGDYSVHFPRSKTTEITTSAGGNEYDLPADFIAIESVEYPQGETPPRYLLRRDYSHDDFWLVEGYFHVRHTTDAGNASSLIISDEPAAGETIAVIYRAQHDATLDVSDTVTVPEHHQHIIRAFARWMALLQLKVAEEKSPTSNSSLLMAQLNQNLYRAQRDYYKLIWEAEQELQARDSAAVPWGRHDAEWRPVY